MKITPILNRENVICKIELQNINLINTTFFIKYLILHVKWYEAYLRPILFFHFSFDFCWTMSQRLQSKQYKYCLFYFRNTKSYGTTKTTDILEGWRTAVHPGKLVKLNWGDEGAVDAEVIQMDGLYNSLNL